MQKLKTIHMYTHTYLEIPQDSLSARSATLRKTSSTE